MTFRLIPLPYAPFAPLFALDPAALRPHLAERHVAAGGEPCRVSLEEAAAGETLLLVNHRHQPAATPYRGTHAVYVRENATEARPAAGTIAPALRPRPLSLRAFDAEGRIVAGVLAPGREAGGPIAALLDDPAVAEVHVHYALLGCYAARAVRAA